MRLQDSKPSSQGKLRHVKIRWQARFKTATRARVSQRGAGVRKEEEGYGTLRRNALPPFLAAQRVRQGNGADVQEILRREGRMDAFLRERVATRGTDRSNQSR